MLPRLPRQLIFFIIIALCFSALLIRSLMPATSNAIKSSIRSVESRQNAPSTHKPTEKPAEQPMCEYNPECPSPDLTIKLVTEGKQSAPLGCLNDIRVFEAKDLKQGLNVVVLNEELLVELMIAFNVEQTDEKLISWLQTFKDHRAVLVVSVGDIAEHISPDARKLMGFFGAKKFKDWRQGEAYAMLGQWGLVEGGALELISPLSIEFGPRSQLIDCYAFPLGELRNVSSLLTNTGIVNRVDETKLAEFIAPVKEEVHLGKVWKHCGRDSACRKDEIAMHFYSGENMNDSPKMCIADRMIFAKDLNDAGRGLNIAVIDPKRRMVVRVGHFDTYAFESTGLERFLDEIAPGQLVAVVSFDEASNMLSEMASRIFYELGSSMIERIKFRAAWYFVGQKGINSYSPFEDLKYPIGNKWALAIKAYVCVPTSLSGHMDAASLQVLQKQNIPRRHFCAKYDGHMEFCADSHIDEPITPRPIINKANADDPVFNLPIILVSGLNFDSLRRSLQSLLEQPGINTQMILVAHNKEYKEVADLSTLYHAKPLPLNSTSSYNTLLQMATSAAFSLFPKADAIIVIEEDVVLAPDFISTMSQLLPILRSDRKLGLIQAFNYNGFVRLSRDPALVYRVENHNPAFAFMLKRAAYENGIRGHSDCCTRLHHWKMSPATSDALVVDVSRVKILNPAPVIFDNEIAEDTARIFKESRVHSEIEVNLDIASVATEDQYIQSIRSSMMNTTVFTTKKFPHWRSCKPGDYGTVLQQVFRGQNQNDFVVIYETNAEYRVLLDCFGALHFADWVPGKYRGFTRFLVDDLYVVLQRV